MNIAVHLMDREGTQHNHYYARRSLSATPVAPGESLTVDFAIPYPADLERFCFEIDLVAEHVAWFETVGSQVFRVEIDRQ